MKKSKSKYIRNWNRNLALSKFIISNQPKNFWVEVDEDLNDIYLKIKFQIKLYLRCIKNK